MGFFKKKPGAKGIRPKTSRVKVYVHGRSVLCCGCRLLRRSDQTPGSDDNEKLGGRLSIATHKNADRAITDGDQMKEAFLRLSRGGRGGLGGGACPRPSSGTLRQEAQAWGGCMC